MDVPYQTIELRFKEVKRFLVHDLKVLVEGSDGVNYTAALLIACACETLAWFKYGRQNLGDQFLRDMMLPDDWKPVSKSLYSALRNGLAHAFETMNIQAGHQRFDIGVSWSGQQHLTFNNDRSVLYLNVQTMATDLLRAIDSYDEELKTQPQLRAVFYKTMHNMKHKFCKDVSQNTSEKAAWERLMIESRKSNS